VKGSRPSTDHEVRQDAADGDADVALLRAWNDGDARAGERLMKRYYWRIHRFFELRHAAQAQDLTQRTLLGCLVAVDGFRHASSFRTFVFAIARRQLLDHERKSSTRSVLQARFGDALPKATPTSVSGIVARAEEQRLLLRALAMLPAELAETIQLFYWEDMPVAEIGSVMDVPTSTVTTRLARARDRLRRNLEELAQSSMGQDVSRNVDTWLRSVAPGRVEDPASEA
jgi:RNA polymerase sigma-70 factor (ECF subfamily)